MRTTVGCLKRLIESVDSEREIARAVLSGDHDSFLVLQDLWEEQGKPKETDKQILLQMVLDSADKKIKVDPTYIRFEELPTETGCTACHWRPFEDQLTKRIMLLQIGDSEVEFGYTAHRDDDGYTQVGDGHMTLFEIDPEDNVVVGDETLADDDDRPEPAISDEDAAAVAKRVMVGFNACNEYVDRFLDAAGRGLGIKLT